MKKGKRKKCNHWVGMVLAFYPRVCTPKLFTAVSCGLYYESFTIVNYDRNDSTFLWPLL
jgi:hypothetical protein